MPHFYIFISFKMNYQMIFTRAMENYNKLHILISSFS